MGRRKITVIGVCVCFVDDLYAACDEFNTTAVQFAARANTLNRNK